MQIKQLSLFVENRTGAVTGICNCLKDNGIDIRTLCIADTEQFGIIRLLVKDNAKAEKVLAAAGFAAKTTEVFALLVPDVPGGLAGILNVFDRRGVAVEYMYAFTFGKAGKAVIVFSFADPEKAAQVIREEGLETASEIDIFK